MLGSSVMAGIRKVSISHTQLDGLLGNTVILTAPSSPEDPAAPFFSVGDEALRNYNDRISLGFC